ncbi:MAG: transcriptional regulator [Magnetococcales bacterium]|nr:transcriptional regulator [Magnetococcales bacterium]
MGNKRNLFDELSQSIEEAQQFDSGKVTLKTTHLQEQPPLRIDAQTILDTRESLNLSRGVFARWLRVSPRTLENWEQGRSNPNSQAAALILMIRKFPDTVDRLAALT